MNPPTPEKPIDEQTLEELIESAARMKLEHIKLLQKSDLIIAALANRIRMKDAEAGRTNRTS